MKPLMVTTNAQSSMVLTKAPSKFQLKQFGALCTLSDPTFINTAAMAKGKVKIVH